MLLLLSPQASYALGYNLAIEYLADYEKTWMLDSFRDINSRVLNKDIDWIFLEVRHTGGVLLVQHWTKDCLQVCLNRISRMLSWLTNSAHTCIRVGATNSSRPHLNSAPWTLTLLHAFRCRRRRRCPAGACRG